MLNEDVKDDTSHEPYIIVVSPREKKWSLLISFLEKIGSLFPKL